MTRLIHDYEESCRLVKLRINQLTKQRNQLRKNGNTAEIAQLDLERRIKLLYKEHEQMSEVILHLSQYMRRREENA